MGEKGLLLMGRERKAGSCHAGGRTHSEEQGTGKVRQLIRQDVEAKISGVGGYIQLPVQE